jgi:hypothetical protein
MIWNSNSQKSPCSAGKYCAAGSGPTDETNCPAGTFGDLLDIIFTSESDCQLCEAGRICSLSGLTSDILTQSTFDCPAGSYCPDGLASDPPTCNMGYYCPLNSKWQISCGPGTYNDQEGKSLVSACQNCPAGYACPGYANEGRCQTITD